MDWATVRIGDLGRVVTGKTPPSSLPAMFVGDVPFFTPSDMEYDKRDVEPERHVSADWDPRRRVLLPDQSVCVVCIGATIGKVCMTKRASHTNQQVNSVVVDKERFDPSFVYYSLRLAGDELKSKATGAATPIINKSSFSDVTIRAPSQETQQRIAAILGAYDDLIEVNRRRVALLEELARELFEEWFVRFRFPGYEDVPLVDTPNGSLPYGWDWGAVSDIAEKTGTNHNPSTTPDEKFAHFSLPAFDANRTPAINQGDEIKSNKTEFSAPVVLVSKLNPRIPRVWHVQADHSHRQLASTEFVPLAPSGPYGSSLLWVMVSDASFRDRLVGMAGGTSTSHQRVKPKDILATPIPLAPSAVIEQANGHIGPLVELSLNLTATNRDLAAARDLLLPRLISGQLSVETAERELEDAA